MRHGISGRKLNRKSSHRSSLLNNLSKSLIQNEQIETTLPKAKDLRPYVEKILNIGKKQDLKSKRKVFSYLRNKSLVKKVFDILAKRYGSRNGGYVRILKSNFRYGDSAPMAIIELVDRDPEAKGRDDRERLKKKEAEEDKSRENLEKKFDSNEVSKEQKKEYDLKKSLKEKK